MLTGTKNEIAVLGIEVPLFKIFVLKYLLKLTDPVTAMFPVAMIPVKEICQNGVGDEAPADFE